MNRFIDATRSRVLTVFLAFVAEEKSVHDTEIQAVMNVCERANLHKVKDFFAGRVSLDPSTITRNFLVECAIDVGLHKSCFKPQHSFNEMLACIHQHNQGLITDAELILALQLSPHQTVAAIEFTRLPYKVQALASIASWDEDIDIAVERGDMPRCV